MNQVKFIDSEEKKLIESLEKDGWKSTKKLEDWKTLLSKTASETSAQIIHYCGNFWNMQLADGLEHIFPPYPALCLQFS